MSLQPSPVTVHIDHLVVERNDDGSFHIRGTLTDTVAVATTEECLGFSLQYLCANPGSNSSVVSLISALQISLE